MQKSKTVLSIFLIGVILICAIYIVSTLGKQIKVDFTQENLYSLTKGTKNILKKLNKPIVMKLYYSKTAANKGSEGIRAFNSYYEYVRDLLEEFVSHSRNNIRLEVIDPRPDTPDEEDAIRYGLKKFQLTESESYIFGLVVRNDLGTDKVIEFFDPKEQETLEYNVTRLIYSVTHPERKKVGILSSLQVLNSDMSPYMAQMMRMQGKPPPESWTITTVLKDFFELKEIKQDVEKIDNIDILFIVHPKSFSEKTLFAIDQFILNGGKLLLLVDPHSLSDTSAAMGPMGQPAGSTGSNLTVLMRNWGVEMKEGQFAGDKQLAGKGRVSQFGPPQTLLPLLTCDRRCTTEAKDSISINLNQILMVFPGALTKVDEKAENITPILMTTKAGNSYTAQGYELQNPAMILDRFTSGSKPVVMAYKITGEFKTAFPNGITISENDAKDPKKSKTRKITGINQSKKPSAIIVFSDVDFIADQFAFRKNFFGLSAANDNFKLVLNSLESLTGSNDLISIRSKGRFNRSFDVVDAIEEDARKRTANKVKEINASIQKFTQELDSLKGRANAENIGLLKNESMHKRKDINKKIAILKGQLRSAKREGREKIETMGSVLQKINTLLIPSILLIIGLVLFVLRTKKKKLYLGK